MADTWVGKPSFCEFIFILSDTGDVDRLGVKVLVPEGFKTSVFGVGSLFTSTVLSELGGKFSPVTTTSCPLPLSSTVGVELWRSTSNSSAASSRDKSLCSTFASLTPALPSFCLRRNGEDGLKLKTTLKAA